MLASLFVPERSANKTRLASKTKKDKGAKATKQNKQRARNALNKPREIKKELQEETKGEKTTKMNA
jgi:hypothetical protein